MKLSAYIMVLLLAITSVFAVTVSDVTLTDDQQRSNPSLDGRSDTLEDRDELSYAVFDIPVFANAGDVTVENVTLNSGFTFVHELTGENTQNDTFIVETPLPVVVANDTTQNIRVRVLIPADLDAITTDFQQQVHSVTATVQTSQGSENSVLSFTVENLLVLDKIEIDAFETIDCDPKNQYDKILECDEEIEELLVGQGFSLAVDLENDFDSNDNIDFNEVDFRIDDDSDVEADRSSDEFDIDSGDSSQFTTSFDVADDLDDGDDVTITISAEVIDDNGAVHGFEYEIEMKFEVPEYDMSSVYSVASSAICPGEEVIITYEVENLGEEEQDNVEIIVRSDRLEIQERISGIELESYDDSDRRDRGSFVLMTPQDATPGTYQFTIQTSFDDEDEPNDRRVETETRSVTLRDCTEVVEEQETQTAGSSSQSELEVIQAAPQIPSTVTQVQSRTQSGLSWVDTVLIVVGMILIALIIMAVMVLVAPKQKLKSKKRK